MTWPKICFMAAKAIYTFSVSFSSMVPSMCKKSVEVFCMCPCVFTFMTSCGLVFHLYTHYRHSFSYQRVVFLVNKHQRRFIFTSSLVERAFSWAAKSSELQSVIVCSVALVHLRMQFYDRKFSRKIVVLCLSSSVWLQLDSCETGSWVRVAV